MTEKGFNPEEQASKTPRRSKEVILESKVFELIGKLRAKLGEQTYNDLIVKASMADLSGLKIMEFDLKKELPPKPRPKNIKSVIKKTPSEPTES